MFIQSITVAVLLVGGFFADLLARRFRGERVTVQTIGLALWIPALFAFEITSSNPVLIVCLVAHGYGLDNTFHFSCHELDLIRTKCRRGVCLPVARPEHIVFILGDCRGPLIRKSPTAARARRGMLSKLHVTLALDVRNVHSLRPSQHQP